MKFEGKIFGAEGPYIVWENNGNEGWSPKSYQTLKEAVSDQRHATEWVMTKIVPFEVNEVSG